MKNFNTILLVAIVSITMLNASFGQNTKLPRVKNQIKGNGIPATPKQIAYTQPDGSIIHLFLKGDGAIHWAVSADGYTLLVNSNGIYEYAKKDGKGNLISSSITAHNPNERSSNEIAFLSNVEKGINFSTNQISNKLATYRTTNRSGAKSFPATGIQENLVLLVDFSDLAFSNTVTDVDNLMNQSNYGGIGSFKDYYYQNSNGKLTVNTTVDGIYTASNNHDYYGQNDGDGNDMNVEELVAAVINAADAYIDFSNFDNDDDGIVDCVYIIYAGTGEASSANPNDIWPHNNPSITPITVDGVTVNSYTCSNELNGTDLAGIGTICHEFGHALSLPDFYDTDYAESGGQAEGTGTWDVMCGGNSNGNEASPANHNPISKEFLGWQDPEIIDNDGFYTLPPSTQDTIAFLIEASASNEVFYLENRQMQDFDSELKGHGMLIYHCDVAYFMDHLGANNINADPTHQGVDIEEADDEIADEIGDTYPGTTNNTSFTDNTNPSSILWSSANLDYPIINIEEDNTTGDITFDISGFVGVNNIFAIEDIVVYPNPTSDKVYIKSDKEVQVKVFNLIGEQIYTGNTNICNFVNLKQKGIYIFELTTSKTRVCKKVVVE